MRHRQAPEAFQQARLLYATAARITGPRPPSVMLQQQAAPQPVASFTPAYAPLNPRLVDLYARVDDRLETLEACLDARRLRNGASDLAYFGDNLLRDGWRSAMTCADEMAGELGCLLDQEHEAVRAGAPFPHCWPPMRRAMPNTSPRCAPAKSANCWRWACRSGRTSGATSTGRCRRCSRPKT
jgi:hypothetical protein